MISNTIHTPQVVIGIQGEDEIFTKFESARQSSNNQDVSPLISEWYTDAVSKGNIFLSTIENSDVLSFTHKFNSNSTNNQGLFVIEILDPTNTFEDRFFNFFYRGIASYTDVISNYQPGTKLPNNTVEELNLAKIKSDITSLPFTEPLMITFGAGNDARGWAPSQKASLVEVEYGLTREGVRKLTLKLVPNPGLLRRDDSSETEKAVKTGAKTVIKLTENFIVKNKDGKIAYKKPFDVINNLIKKSFSEINKNQSVHVLIDDLINDIKSKWDNAIINAAHQYIPSLYNADIQEFLGSETQEITNIAKLFGESIIRKLNQQDSNLQTVFDLSSPMVVDRWRRLADGTLDEREGKFLVPHGREVEVGGRGFVREPRSGAISPKEYEVIRKQTLAHWKWEERRDVRDKADYKGIVDVGNRFRHAFGKLGTTISNIATSQSWKKIKEDFTEYPWQGKEAYNSRLFSKWTEVGLPEELVWWGAIKGLTPAEKELDPDKALELLAKSLGIDVNQLVLINRIVLNSVDAYTIVLSAAREFFGSLGLTVEEQKKKGSIPVLPTIPLTGKNTQVGVDNGAPTRKLMEKSTNPVDVCIIADDVQHLDTQIKAIINNLGSMASFDPYVACFSETALINEVKKLGLLQEGAQDILIFASYESVKGIIDPDDTDRSIFYVGDPENDVLRGRTFMRLREAFKNFRENEPPIQGSEGSLAGFGTLFQNPNFDSTILSIDGDKVNQLTVFTDADGPNQSVKNNEDFNDLLRKKRMPVFNYGFKNSNVLDFNFDFKPWYAYLIDIIPTTVVNGMISRAVKELDLTEQIAGVLDLKKTDEFKRQIEDYYDKNISSAAISNEISKVIDIGRAKYSELREQDQRTVFVNTMIAFFSRVFQSSTSVEHLLVDPTDRDVVNSLLSLRHKLSTKTFTGTITTLPLFSLMSIGKTLGSRALLYFIEPEVVRTEGYNSEVPRSTWLSGQYIIVGYEVVIRDGDIKTSFNIVKEPTQALGLE